MRIGNVVITTDKAQQSDIQNATQPIKESLVETNTRLAELADYIAKGVTEINKEEGELDATVGVLGLNKNLSTFGLPLGVTFYTSSKQKSRYNNTDMETLRFWSDELPFGPQSIEYVVKSVFARGMEITLRKKGTAENQELRRKIEMFFARANGNGQSLKVLLQAIMRHSMRVGNGYLEKIYNKKFTELKELRLIKPWNVVVLVDKDLMKQGILKVLSYAKVENRHTVDIDKIKEEHKIKPWKIIHDKYIDEGDAEGISPFARNQEITKFIINVLNLNQKRFTNEIRHSIHIKLGRKATQVHADIFLAQYRAKYLGKNNYGMPLITFGDIEVEVLDMETANFDFHEFMKDFGFNHAPSLLNIAPSEIINNDAKYSNASQGHISTVLNTIYDWQEKIEMIVNNEIIPEIEGIVPDQKTGERREDVEPMYQIVLERENLFTMYEHLTALVAAVMSGIMSPDEARDIVDRKNLPPITDENGNPSEWSREYYMRTGSDIKVISQEFFLGTDDSEESGNSNKPNNQEDEEEEDNEDEKDKEKKPKKRLEWEEGKLESMVDLFDKAKDKKRKKEKPKKKPMGY